MMTFGRIVFNAEKTASNAQITTHVTSVKLEQWKYLMITHATSNAELELTTRGTTVLNGIRLLTAENVIHHAQNASGPVLKTALNVLLVTT